ncbi:hypothetical protein BC830DRAFT_1170411 [Chytriomyces sp. MP71]|nr:hypothetical protein BC830DRAFT_1170411 [Chytriomyces sp. MP71]
MPVRILRRTVTTASQTLPLVSLRDQSVVAVSERMFPLWTHASSFSGADAESDAPRFSENRPDVVKSGTAKPMSSTAKRSAEARDAVAALRRFSLSLKGRTSRKFHPILGLSQIDLNASAEYSYQEAADRMYAVLMAALESGTLQPSALLPSGLKQLMKQAPLELASRLVELYAKDVATLRKTDPRLVSLEPFAFLIHRLCAAGQLDDAFYVFSQTLQLNFTPSVSIAAPLIINSTTPASIPRALKVLETLVNNPSTRNRTNASLYNHILRVCFQTNTESSAQVADKTLSALLRFTQPTSETFILLFNNCTDLTRVERIARDLESTPQLRHLLKVDVLQESLLNALARTGGLRVCLEYRTRLHRVLGAPLGAAASTVLARVYLENGNVRAAVRVLDSAARGAEGDVARLREFVASAVVKAPEALIGDASGAWDILRVWIRLMKDARMCASKRELCGAIAFFGRLGNFGTLHALASVVDTGEVSGLPLKLTQVEWRMLTASAKPGDPDLTVALISAFVGLQLPAFEGAVKVVTSYLKNHIQNVDHAVTQLVAAYVKAGRQMSRLDKDRNAEARKRTANVMLDVVSKAPFRNDDIIKALLSK